MTCFSNFGSRGGPQGGSSRENPQYYRSRISDSKDAEFEPPRLAKIIFSDVQSVTLNYHTPRHTLLSDLLLPFLPSPPPHHNSRHYQNAKMPLEMKITLLNASRLGSKKRSWWLDWSGHHLDRYDYQSNCDTNKAILPNFIQQWAILITIMMSIIMIIIIIPIYDVPAHHYPSVPGLISPQIVGAQYYSSPTHAFTLGIC